MDFNPIMTLQEKSLIKLADALWRRHYMNLLVERCGHIQFNTERRRKLNKAIDEIINNFLIKSIGKLFLPETIKKRLLILSKKVGLSKVDWYFYHATRFKITKFPTTFYWTCEGRINRKRTAECMIQDETFDISTRYVMATTYCLEKEIHQLYARISPDIMKHLKCDDALVDIWDNFIKDELLESLQTSTAHHTGIEHSIEDLRMKNKYIQKYKEAYTLSLMCYNAVASEFFWKTLAKQEINLGITHHEILTVRYALEKYMVSFPLGRGKEHYLDMALFLLKQMTKEQQITTLSTLPSKLLELLIEETLNSFPELAHIILGNV